MGKIKIWPHLTIVAVVIALVAGLGVAFWMKHEPTASAEGLPYAARIQKVDGDVAFSNSLPNADAKDADAKDADANDADPQWIAATPNQPFSVGDRIYTRDNARTSLAFSGRNFARLDPNTSLDVVSLGDNRTQLALRDGSAIFDLGYLAPDELFEVATPNGAVDFAQPGLYNVGFDENGGVLVSVLSGLAQVVGLDGTGQINKGEMLTLLGQTAAELALSRINGADASRQVDDYYRYQYGDAYDGRYNDNYDAYLSDPNYYDPSRSNLSYKYASSAIPGINDLDPYGDWQNVDGYGNAWKPRVDSGWVPYQQGAWTNDYPYGPTWVSSEPWGYAPYHYGRWANVGNEWYWVPDPVNTTPAYAPALVAFVPLEDASQIGWVPLAPGESYAPRYYDANWQPRYLTRADVVPTAQLINLGIPGAVTVVPLDAFARVVDQRSIRKVDQQRVASVKPTLDPLTLTPLRNAVIHSAWGRGKIDLPPGIAKKLRDTPVFVGADPREWRFRKDLARSMRVERVSDKVRDHKFKVRDDRNGGDNRGNGDGRGDGRQEARLADNAREADNERNQELNRVRKQEIDRLRGEGATGNRESARQARRLKQQQRDEARARERAEDAQRKAQQQPQGDRVNNPARHPKPAVAPRQERRDESGHRGEHDNSGRGKGKGKPGEQ